MNNFVCNKTYKLGLEIINAIKTKVVKPNEIEIGNIIMDDGYIFTVTKTETREYKSKDGLSFFGAAPIVYLITGYNNINDTKKEYTREFLDYHRVSVIQNPEVARKYLYF